MVEHHLLEPKLVSVYSYLRSIPFDLKVDELVEEGQVIATLGRSKSGNFNLPKPEALLLFDLWSALRLRFSVSGDLIQATSGSNGPSVLLAIIRFSPVFSAVEIGQCQENSNASTCSIEQRMHATGTFTKWQSDHAVLRSS